VVGGNIAPPTVAPNLSSEDNLLRATLVINRYTALLECSLAQKVVFIFVPNPARPCGGIRLSSEKKVQIGKTGNRHTERFF